MPFEKIAGDLMEAALRYLSIDDNTEDKYDSIKLIVNDANGDAFSFVLQDFEGRFQWKRKKWNKKEDIAAITNPIERLKYFGKNIIPNIIEQEGFTTLDEPKNLFILAKTLLKLNNKEKSNQIVIDETEYLLEIKIGEIKKDFSWVIIPDSWNNVEALSQKIIELNNNIY